METSIPYSDSDKTKRNLDFVSHCVLYFCVDDSFLKRSVLFAISTIEKPPERFSSCIVGLFLPEFLAFSGAHDIAVRVGLNLSRCARLQLLAYVFPVAPSESRHCLCSSRDHHELTEVFIDADGPFFSAVKAKIVHALADLDMERL